MAWTTCPRPAIPPDAWRLTITFKAGTDPDIAQVQVQNKLAIATPMLPQEVQRQGVQVTKSTANFLMVVGLISEDGSMSATDLGDYAVANLRDPMSRVEGVGEAGSVRQPVCDANLARSK